jgi:hypothetical protein
MFTACIFCHAPLGANEAVEHFPVGRRLAFDPARGRLWVVCRACERWNLTPLEERWEAIEECERLFGATRLRVSTDNVGLARLREGLELVRIGEPQRPEFAAWRYGDQFGRRRRLNLIRAGLGLGAVGALLVGGAVAGVGIGGFGWWLIQSGQLAVKGSPGKIVARIPDADGTLLRVRRKHLPHVRLLPEGEGGWSLGVPRGHRQLTYLSGDPALRAAGLLLPQMNRYGGRREQVAEAVRLLEEQPDPRRYFARLARTRALGKPVTVAEHPEPVRLALEMATHEDVERRALEGELAELELAWREAEEIAAIADDLLLPSSVHAVLRRMRGG